MSVHSRKRTGECTGAQESRRSVRTHTALPDALTELLMLRFLDLYLAVEPVVVCVLVSPSPELSSLDALQTVVTVISV